MKTMHWSSFRVLGVVLAVTGCGKSTDPKSPVADSTATAPASIEEDHEHSHGHGPHGGVVFDLGSYHAEFTVDHDKQQCAILILDDDAKTPVAVSAQELTLIINETKTKDGKVVESMTIALQPADEADGKASKFVGSNPGIANVAEFAGIVTGEVDGKPAQGEFAE